MFWLVSRVERRALGLCCGAPPHISSTAALPSKRQHYSILTSPHAHNSITASTADISDGKYCMPATQLDPGVAMGAIPRFTNADE
jgi:hypothetical protein